ncbi:MAG: 3-phosphoshikimate 1-carboxyvinyltransferase [Candidatus Levyibacteriota bacterium]|nr:MAG: 3-phosphoshikimate 1-carboxyvinyltransferase [Candidatus Levybacteria bacterium]
MNIKIYPSKISGVINAPPSKSITHRAIIAAALAHGTSVIKNVLFSDDTKYTIHALQQLGVEIEQNKTTLTIYGTGGKLIAPKKPLYVGNSGSTLRMITAIASLAKGETIITGEKRLQKRPIQDLLDALKQINTSIITIDGSKSSQYITALLLIAPFAKNTLEIIIKGDLRSKPYVLLTLDVMKSFGVSFHLRGGNLLTPLEKNQKYKGRKYTVEGDFSSAAYFFAAAAITKGKITVKNLNKNSAQGDKNFLNLLQKIGSTVDMNDYPDIVQTLAVVAAFTKGKTTITNINHLKDKETNRISATAKELRKMGIAVKATNDKLIIQGGIPKGAVINTYNDHRMAMSFAVAGLAAMGETIIQNAEVVNKSYPNFWKDLQNLGAKIEVI